MRVEMYTSGTGGMTGFRGREFTCLRMGRFTMERSIGELYKAKGHTFTPMEATTKATGIKEISMEKEFTAEIAKYTKANGSKVIRRAMGVTSTALLEIVMWARFQTMS